MSLRNPFAAKRDPHTGLAYPSGEARLAAHAAPASTAAVRSDAAAAHTAGRREGRAEQKAADHRRRRHGGGVATGLIAAVVLVAAALGAAWVVLSYRTGSFASGGAVMDQKVAAITQPARDGVRNAADRTGAAIETAGQAVEAQGAKLRPDAE